MFAVFLSSMAHFKRLH